VIRISVNILDENGNPMSGNVSVSGREEKAGSGFPPVYVDVLSGKYYVTVTATGYQPQTQNTPRFPEDLDVCLFPMLFKMQPV